MTGRSAKSALLPFALLWLTAHAALLAIVLGLKFLLTKSVVVALLLAACAMFLVNRVRRGSHRLSHSPAS